DAGGSRHQVSLCVGLKPHRAVLAAQRQARAAARAREFGALPRLARSCGSSKGGKLLRHAAPPFLLVLRRDDEKSFRSRLHWQPRNNRTSRFPASGFPAGFTARHATWPLGASVGGTERPLLDG